MRFLLLRGGAEAAHHVDRCGESGEAALERFKMLEGQHRGRRQHGDLLAVGDRLERRAHRHFGFAVADVAAQQAIHRRGTLHVALDVGDRGVLVGRLLKLECILEFALKISIGSEREALRGLARRVQRKKLVGHVFQRLTHARLAGVPSGAAQLVEHRLRAFDDAIALHQVHALQRNVESRVFLIAQQHEFAAPPIGFDLPQTLELPDAVIHVDDVVAGLEVRKVAEESGRADFLAGPLDGRRCLKQIGIAENRERARREMPRLRRMASESAAAAHSRARLRR